MIWGGCRVEEKTCFLYFRTERRWLRLVAETAGSALCLTTLFRDWRWRWRGGAPWGCLMEEGGGGLRSDCDLEISPRRSSLKRSAMFGVPLWSTTCESSRPSRALADLEVPISGAAPSMAIQRDFLAVSCAADNTRFINLHSTWSLPSRNYRAAPWGWWAGEVVAREAIETRCISSRSQKLRGLSTSMTLRTSWTIVST